MVGLSIFNVQYLERSLKDGRLTSTRACQPRTFPLGHSPAWTFLTYFSSAWDAPWTSKTYQIQRQAWAEISCNAKSNSAFEDSSPLSILTRES